MTGGKVLVLREVEKSLGKRMSRSLGAPTPPPQLGAIEADTEGLGFALGSDPWTGSLLRTLAASKPRGSLLELGTGTGLATCWLLEGMDRQSTLLSVDNDEAVVDDMLPQPTWPEGHQEKATKLVETLSQRSDFRITFLEWSTGLVVAARRGASQDRASEHQGP